MGHLSVYGDSIPAGFGAPLRQGFVPQLAAICAAAKKGSNGYLNFGVPGMTSHDLASALSHNDAWFAGLWDASIVCVLIGGDDIIQTIPLVLSRDNTGIQHAISASAIAYRTLLTKICRHGACPVVAATIYNPFPNTGLAETIIGTFNETVIRPAAASLNVPIAPVHTAFAGNQAALIAGYTTGIAGQAGRAPEAAPIHPNERGHRVIAETFASVMP